MELNANHSFLPRKICISLWPRSLFYRQTPGVEKYRSPVHELYMRPYNYVSYSMGGSKPVAYNYHYQTPNTLPEPSYPAPYKPHPYTPAPSFHVTPHPKYSPQIPHHSPSLPPLRYSTPAPVTYPPPHQYQPQPIIVSTPKPLPNPPSYSSFPKVSRFSLHSTNKLRTISIHHPTAAGSGYPGADAGN